MRFIDISNWQGDINLPALLPDVDAVICKATEGATFVDQYCDGWVQQCINAGKPWGFYHFAGSSGAFEEASSFVHNCQGYFRKGIPILDWEGNQSVGWVNAFMQEVHDKTGVWPWIYANPWRFNKGVVEPNCARWVAEYPAVTSPSFEQAGTENQWRAYALGGNTASDDGGDNPSHDSDISVLENDEYKVTIERKK